MVCVLFGHYNYFYWKHQPQAVKYAFLINELIYLVHMPLFFILSLVFCKPLTKEVFKQNTLKILLPFFLWIWRPNFIFNPVEAISSLNEAINKFLKGSHAAGAGVLWFLPVLFLLKILHSAYLRVISNKIQKNIFLASIFISFIFIFYNKEYFGNREVFGRASWGFTEVLFLYPLFLIAKNLYQRYQSSNINMIFMLLFVVSSSIVIFNFVPSRNGHRVDLAQFNLPDSLLMLFLLLLLWSAALLFCCLLFRGNNLFNRMFAKIGYFSFSIFLLHEQMLGFFDKYTVLNISEEKVFYRIGASVFSIIISIYSIFWISRIAMRISNNFSYFGFVSDKLGAELKK